MKKKKSILLKLSGEILLSADKRTLDNSLVYSIAEQIKKLSNDYFFGIVIGGGNFFRGSKHGSRLGITPSIGHQIGMLGTMMNGLIIKDLFEQKGLETTLFCAVPSAEVGIPISQQALKLAMEKDRYPIFTGGTGNPFFTTDTTAVLRGLQMDAEQVWKGTHVDGIYSDDPKINSEAHLIKKITYQEAITKNLKIMDATAFALAKEYHLPIRIFDVFKPDAILQAAENKNFGSIVE